MLSKKDFKFSFVSPVFHFASILNEMWPRKVWDVTQIYFFNCEGKFLKKTKRNSVFCLHSRSMKQDIYAA